MNIINTQPVDYPTVTNSRVLAVLTQDAAGLYAVYIGIVDKDAVKENASLWVAHNGSKLSYAKALAYFPNIPDAVYRS